eukprot:s581_g25.t1
MAAGWCGDDDFRFTGKVLGTGCSGAVLQAVDRSAEATEASAAPAPKVAIKNYDLDLLDDSQRQRLQGELEVFLSLDHPHIARLLYVYESDNGLSLVMECMEGGELYDRVIHGSGQPGQEAALATWHMLQAISYIHSTGVVHRDLKLENFLYDFKDSDFLKLIDFGFSKFFCMKKKMKEALGTIAYVAPEVLKKRYSGGSCDMWSLGVIVYVLLTGEMPFQGKCDVDVATAVMRGSYSWKASHRFRVCKEGRDFVENQALTALRNCSGALEDLAEVRPLPATEAGPKEETGPAPEGSKSSEAASAPGAEPSKGEVSVPPEKEKKETKEKSKKKREKPEKREEEDPGGEVTPKEEQRKEKKSRPAPEAEEAKGSGGHRPSTPIGARLPTLQERVDRFVCDHPDNFALGHLPVRGSAGRHFRERDDRGGERRPAEPRDPPRRNHGEPRRHFPARSSQPGEKKKKSKGAKHRRRGRDWAQRQR